MATDQKVGSSNLLPHAKRMHPETKTMVSGFFRLPISSGEALAGRTKSPEKPGKTLARRTKCFYLAYFSAYFFWKTLAEAERCSGNPKYVGLSEPSKPQKGGEIIRESQIRRPFGAVEAPKRRRDDKGIPNTSARPGASSPTEPPNPKKRRSHQTPPGKKGQGQQGRSIASGIFLKFFYKLSKSRKGGFNFQKLFDIMNLYYFVYNPGSDTHGRDQRDH